ncbi:MAG: N-6 DNA methylase [Pseudomonadota bacterium]
MINIQHTGDITTDLSPIIAAFKEIGYKNHLIRSDYEFADFFEKAAFTRHIKLGVFGQEPLNYRSACFGVDFRKRDDIHEDSINEFRAFGSPVIFIIQNGITRTWRNTGQRLIPEDEIKTDQLPNFIKSKKEIWEPEVMIRAKTGFKKPGPRQLDFVDIGLMPALETEASRKLDGVIKGILYVVEQAHLKDKIKFDAQKIFQVLFRFLTAKLIKDSSIPQSNDIDFKSPDQILKIVSGYYGSSEKPLIKNIPKDILSCMSDEIGGIFSLKNISVDTLTYIYENTFVTEKSRKEMGIHSTPSYVAEYVVSQLPIEELPRNEWNFLDPTCGHGIFLIAAMRRMRELLPANWSGKKRHQFFVDKLHGIEIDAFSIEVARMCLMLADFPESNSWDLQRADIFSGKILEQNTSETTILIGNPPFEKLIVNGKEQPKPAYLLKRALPAISQAGMIGMVLPRSFLDGKDYRNERSILLKDFEILTLAALPDKIFLHSEAETAILVARKRKAKKGNLTTYREVKDHHKERFRLNAEATWEDKVPQIYFSENQQNRLIVPVLREVWSYLGVLPKLEKYIDIKKGVEYESGIIKNRRHEVIQAKPFPESRPGIYEVSEGFRTFVAEDIVYLDTNEKLRRKRAIGAWDLDWDLPKVLVPTARTSRGPWRYAAATDNTGRIVSRMFYVIWPTQKTINVELLAALLNSPIAQAFVYAHSFQRNISARVYSSIPVPLNFEKADLFIQSLVNKYIATQYTDPEAAKELLFHIDAEILKLYNLPPKLERQLLDLFWGDTRRKVPFEFKGYIPPENASWIPLHIFISDQYKEATPEKILKNIQKQPDEELLKDIKEIWQEIP